VDREREVLGISPCRTHSCHDKKERKTDRKKERSGVCAFLRIGERRGQEKEEIKEGRTMREIRRARRAGLPGRLGTRGLKKES